MEQQKNGKKHFEAPGTLVLVLFFFFVFIVIYFGNWFLLSKTWFVR